nr:uncharacterized protein LOC109147413 [Ipomoea batatas]GME17952.1 uncharacterized protein LOC109147413 [Ipomoea batatas]
MLEGIRVGVMRRIATKIKSVERWIGNYGPLIMKKLNQNILESVGWKVDFNGDDGYEIKKGRNQLKVEVENRSCSCRSWDLSGIPCVHAICAIFDQGRDPEGYIDAWRPKRKRNREASEVPSSRGNGTTTTSGTTIACGKLKLSKKGKDMRCSISASDNSNYILVALLLVSISYLYGNALYLHLIQGKCYKFKEENFYRIYG